jgi:hypothetical protein
MRQPILHEKHKMQSEPTVYTTNACTETSSQESYCVLSTISVKVIHPTSQSGNGILIRMEIEPEQQESSDYIDHCNDDDDTSNNYTSDNDARSTSTTTTNSICRITTIQLYQLGCIMKDMSQYPPPPPPSPHHFDFTTTTRTTTTSSVIIISTITISVTRRNNNNNNNNNNNEETRTYSDMG